MKKLIKLYQIHGEAAYSPFTSYTLKITSDNYHKSGTMFLIVHRIDFFGFIEIRQNIFSKQYFISHHIFHLFVIYYYYLK